MPYKRRGEQNTRSCWYVWPTLPGIGRVGPWSTGVRSRQTATRMEDYLKDVAVEKPGLVELLRRGRVNLRELWQAKVQKREDELLQNWEDPLLSDAAKRFEPQTDDLRVRDGLRELNALAQAVEQQRARDESLPVPEAPAVRLSWLLSARNVNEMYTFAIQQGASPNSVRRSVHRAVADLLAHHFGKAKRDFVMVDVRTPGEDDTREVRLLPEEIRLLLKACDSEFRDMVALAMLLAIDQTPLLLITPRFVDLEMGTLDVLDSKNPSRLRTIELSSPALAILRSRCAGLRPDERLFAYTKDQVRHRWEEARDRAARRPSRNLRQPRGRAKNLAPRPDPVGEAAERLLEEQGIVTLPVLRFKDLRHLLPTAWNALALSPEDLKGIMGWARHSNMAARYTTARIQGDRVKLDRVAEFLGLNEVGGTSASADTSGP